METALHSELAEATKRDLGVFVSTVQEESTKTVAVTSASLATKIQKDMLPTEAGAHGARVEFYLLITSCFPLSFDTKLTYIVVSLLFLYFLSFPFFLSFFFWGWGGGVG